MKQGVEIPNTNKVKLQRAGHSAWGTEGRETRKEESGEIICVTSTEMTCSIAFVFLSFGRLARFN